MSQIKTIEVPVKGMDCNECVEHVSHALNEVPGITNVKVYLAAEKAVFKADPDQVSLAMIRQAVAKAGYHVPGDANIQAAQGTSSLTRSLFTALGIVFSLVILVTVMGEWLGFIESVTQRIPWFIWLGLALVGGYPVFMNVMRAAMKKQVVSHTLMTLGVMAAIAVGEWATALVIVMFMRVGNYVEGFTTERARRALKDLTALAPQTARLLKNGQEQEVSLEQVKVGDVIIVRPGEKIAADGEVVEGQGTIDQSSITGESMAVEAGPGSKVFAATINQLGSLQIRAAAVGADTTFGKVIRLVEEAEANRADVQLVADKFAGYYLPVVAGIALLTFLLRRDPLATAAVLVVACSCSFALATPIAMLASIGAGARQGLLIKGGKYLELLARANTLFVDKTGTLTLGKPQITDIVPLNGVGANELLQIAASAERFSEHPLAKAVREAAVAHELSFLAIKNFNASPGLGIQAEIQGDKVLIGSAKNLGKIRIPSQTESLELQGKTLIFVLRNDALIGYLAAADTPRPDIKQALQDLRSLGIRRIELLTGDNPRAAEQLALYLGIDFHAEMLPEDKIAIIEAAQKQGQRVIMVGDGINDAPALAQADVGIAMGAAGSDIAIEAAHIALMRDDWRLVPQALRIAKRSMGVVRGNILFTALYNLIGLSLAALGILPPVLAAAAQSLPDLGILANSARLLRK